MASYSSTATSASVATTLYGVSGKYYRVFVFENGDSSLDRGNGWNYTSNYSVTDEAFRLIKPNTKYLVSVYMASDSSYSDATPVGSPAYIHTIDKWSWYISNGSATAAQTQLAYNAVAGTGTNNKKVSNFSYLVWNDLCGKVYTCVQAEGDIWWTNMGVNLGATPTYGNSLMTASDRTLTAARFNAVRGNVGGRVSTGINPVSKGDQVLGSYFTTIVNSLNNWISMLTQA